MQVQKEEAIEKTVQVRRVAKVVKGGRRFGFSALVVVGDGKGRAGFAIGKANEVASAIKKGSKAAKNAMKHYPSYKGTVPHETLGKFCSGRVMVKPLPPGSGIIACIPVRAVVEALGITDINVKSLGSNNPINLVRATFQAFSQLRTFKEAADLRGKTEEEVCSIQF